MNVFFKDINSKGKFSLKKKKITDRILEEIVWIITQVCAELTLWIHLIFR